MACSNRKGRLIMDRQQYILRYAAGRYWIIKIDQQEPYYVPPFLVNECGAAIWKGLEAGYNTEELAKLLENQYGIDSAEAFIDIKDFLEQLANKEII